MQLLKRYFDSFDHFKAVREVELLSAVLFLTLLIDYLSRLNFFILARDKYSLQNFPLNCEIFEENSFFKKNMNLEATIVSEIILYRCTTCHNYDA